ncbi:MAG: histidine phosphatase family protein [Gemmatimonadetes bacterium]|jgi:broad specificity phosphatase PhoE|nr:histidine phosphatase family protein [Gemmatimonadota bacterium]MBT7587459.1 histidine phosphatase family protein [Gemmatimonadota bacterium]|tara:strand:+ start:409 stop:996 length:588 start_codon:yes stop_codon:yes gene_type:complete
MLDPTSDKTSVTLYLVRHGEVHNPAGVIYGHLPGFGLSERGRGQIAGAAEVLATHGPFSALYASPLQRAQESAGLLAEPLGLLPVTEQEIIETGIGSFQGRRFEELPRPYITEEGAHPELESAASIRMRFLRWADRVRTRHAGGRVIAVSHRDPIIVALLYWTGVGLEALPDFPLETGAVYEVCLDGEIRVSALT